MARAWVVVVAVGVAVVVAVAVAVDFALSGVKVVFLAMVYLVVKLRVNGRKADFVR